MILKIFLFYILHLGVVIVFLILHLVFEVKPPLDQHMVFFCWLKKGEKSASSTCWLKLSALCDLLDIVLCTLGPEARRGSS